MGIFHPGINNKKLLNKRSRQKILGLKLYKFFRNNLYYYTLTLSLGALTNENILKFTPITSSYEYTFKINLIYRQV